MDMQLFYVSHATHKSAYLCDTTTDCRPFECKEFLDVAVVMECIEMLFCDLKRSML